MSAIGRKSPVVKGSFRPIADSNGESRRAMYDGNRYRSSNLSFTAKFSKHKPLIFLEKVGGLWFLASEKRPYGTDMRLEHYVGAKKWPAERAFVHFDPVA